MPRRKKTDDQLQPDAATAASATAVATEPPPADAGARDAHADPHPGADATREGEQPKNWGNPYKATFTCPAKRFELGEDRRFKQMRFTFAENPGPEVTQKLKDAGFKYRANEKAWTVRATPASRELATTLAHELKSEAPGVSR